MIWAPRAAVIGSRRWACGIHGRVSSRVVSSTRDAGIAKCCEPAKMVTRLRQTRHKRGQLTMGYGRVGKHRKHPCGRGLAGGQHHHRTNFDKYHPGYFGKVGMRHFHNSKNPQFTPTVNVGQLWSLLGPEALVLAEKAKAEGKAATIDVSNYGFFKVLGKGELPALPIVVKARFVSSIAERKIKASGGAVILSA